MQAEQSKIIKIGNKVRVIHFIRRYVNFVRSRFDFKRRFPEWQPRVSLVRGAWNIWLNTGRKWE